MYVTALDLLRQPELQRPGDTPFPPNPVVQALQLHAEMNLHKLRNGRNIAGLERQSAPEELPASLLSSSGQLRRSAAIALRPTPYRYAVLMERAKQLVTIAQQIEATFLSFLERRDAEAYSLLKARQDQQLSRAGLTLQTCARPRRRTGGPWPSGRGRVRCYRLIISRGCLMRGRIV
jgi:hypothetical protein